MNHNQIRIFVLDILDQVLKKFFCFFYEENFDHFQIETIGYSEMIKKLVLH